MKLKPVLRSLSIYVLMIALLLSSLPMAAIAESYTATVNVSKMVVRDGPTTKDKNLGSLKKGTQVTVLSEKDGIAYIEYKGKQGYARLSDLKTDAPKPTSSTFASVSGLATIADSSIKVYASASTSSKVLGTYKKGATFTLLETTASGWAKLQNGKNVGYAKLSGLSIQSGTTATPAPTLTPAPTKAPSEWWLKENQNKLAVVTASRMIVRAGESSSDKQLGYLSKGTSFTVRAVSGSVAYVEYKGNLGFAKTSDFSYAENDKDSFPCICTVLTDNMKVYKSAKTSSKVLGKYKKGLTFTVLSITGDWAKLENGKNIGYAKVSDLEIKPGVTPTPVPAATPGIVPSMSEAAFMNASTKVYKNMKTSSSVVVTLSKGTEVTMLGVSDPWALISQGKNQGYVKLTSLCAVEDYTLKESLSISAKTKNSSTQVYQYASDKSKSLGTVSKGVEVTILAYNADWALIDRNGNKGYCKLSALSMIESPTLKETENIEAKTVASAALYTYATKDSKKLTTIAKNKKITVLADNDTWCLVSYDKYKGYALKSTVTLLSTSVLKPNESYTATVTSKSTVYKYAHTGSDSLGTVAKNAKVTLLAHDDEWGLIQSGDKKGYIAISALKVQTDEFENPTVKNVTATVIQASSKVYEHALESANGIGTLSIGSSVNVTAYTSKWARVNSNGKEGYVLISCLSTESYKELKSGSSSGNDVLKLQKALEDLGYFDGIPAGNYGSLTTSAVQRLQTEMGITATGVADIDTLRVLYGGHAPVSSIRSTELKLNSTGSSVLRLQNRLTYKGYLNASLDGDYGSITQKAVKLYQSKAGLTETGTADLATLKSLFSSSAPKNTGSAVTGSGASTGGSTGGSSGTGNYSTNPDDDPGVGTGSSKAETVIQYAMAQLGKPYIYGTAGTSSYDCSGLTKYCYNKVGVSLSRSAYSVGYTNGTKIEGINNLVRGDIVCFNTLSDSDLSDHVGIYLGNKKFIHASSGAGKVVISSLASGYYNRVFSWGRRVL